MERAVSEALRKLPLVGKIAYGKKETMASIKGSKLVVYSSSVDEETVGRLEGLSRRHSVPMFKFEGTSADLAQILGVPFKVSMLSVRFTSEEDMKRVYKALGLIREKKKL